MTTIAAPTDRAPSLPTPAGSRLAAFRLDRRIRRAVTELAQRPPGDRLMIAGTAVGALTRLVVLALAWRLLGVAEGWHPAAWIGIGVVAGWLAGQVPVFVTTYLVWRRRLMRQVEAELDARWPDRRH